MNVALIGASDKTERYSYMALDNLLESEHTVFPVHPKLTETQGQKVYNSIAEIDAEIDTVTLYVGSAHSYDMIDDILSLKPRRIIFNPGAENDTLKLEADAQGITTMYACTLVLLSTGQF